MNPLNLLTKGRTFKGLKDRPGVYKLPARSTLPNFSALKGHEAASRPAVEVSPPFSPLPNLFGAKISAALSPALEPPAPKAAEAPASPAIMTKSGGDFLNLAAQFCGRFREKWMPKRKASTVPAPSVQAELALEKITVVRNDLSEEEMEVVAVQAKARARKKAEKPEPEELMTKT